MGETTITWCHDPGRALGQHTHGAALIDGAAAVELLAVTTTARATQGQATSEPTPCRPLARKPGLVPGTDCDGFLECLVVKRPV